MTKRFLILLTALGAVAQLNAQQSFVADKVVAVVGNSSILYSDVVQQAERVTEQYREQNYTSPRDAMYEALEALLEQKLLANQAQIDSIEISNYASHISSMIDDDIARMTAEAGSLKALEDLKRRPVYSLRDDIKRDYEEYFSAYAMRNHITGEVKVTPGEVDRFYRKTDRDSLPIVPEQYVYAQITKFPKSTETAKKRARERLLELRQRIVDGERFDRLAIMYSVDPGSSRRGGEMDPAPKESFVEPFAEALAKLKPGQVSGVVETSFGFHIIQLIDKPAENLYHARHILIRPVYTDEELHETIGRLDSIAGLINNGDMTFEEAALKHSDDASSKFNGGIVSNQEALLQYYHVTDPSETRTRHFKDNITPNDIRYLGALKPGEVSRAFISEDFSYNRVAKMVKLIEIVPAHTANIADDYLDIEKMALAAKQDTHYKQWLAKKIDEMYVKIDPMFDPTQFENKHWIK